MKPQHYHPPQTLPRIDEVHEIETFADIDEIELQHAATIAGTSARVMTG
jgi:hypothetical protein